MIIIGAGMAGLIAAHAFRAHKPTVLESQPALPDNHGALLRFRTDAVARLTGIPFRKVRVTKAVFSENGLTTDITLRDHNLYAHKVTGAVMNRSILSLESADRYVAPDDFLARLAEGVDVKFGCVFDANEIQVRRNFGTEPVIVSTIPMPALMALAEWEEPPKFPHREIWSVTVMLPECVDVYQTIYYPGSEPYYRASLTGSKLIIEYNRDPGNSSLMNADSVCDDFGLPVMDDMAVSAPKRHKYGKLLPIDDQLRRAFILAMTDMYGIYSLGRFATWRQLLLDDVAHDAQVIDGFISQRSAYARRMHDQHMRHY